MVILGIDPGATGAVSVFDGQHWDVYDAPVLEAKRGRRYISPELTSCLLREEIGDRIGLNRISGRLTHAYIERQQAMPGQGVSSTFQLGRNFGIWQGVLAGLGIPTTIVSPRVWKKALKVTGDNQKEAARARALQLMPYLANELARKKDHGRADALLIGEYGRRDFGISPAWEKVAE